MSLHTDLEHKISLAETFLRKLSENYQPISLANSLSAEDMVITDIIARTHIPIDIFTLDTGRLHQETYELLAKITDKYAIPVKVLYPENKDLELFVQTQGINAFYKSVDSRKTCCQIRKVAPLKRALAGQKAWITGLRREQSVTREELQSSAWDDHFKLHKFSPLCDWSEQNVWDYIRHFDVPYNVLHEKQFPSIGCAPCTRAINPTEDIRAGRWWWEDPKEKECGLHANNEEKISA